MGCVLGTPPQGDVGVLPTLKTLTRVLDHEGGRDNAQALDRLSVGLTIPRIIRHHPTANRGALSRQAKCGESGTACSRIRLGSGAIIKGQGVW